MRVFIKFSTRKENISPRTFVSRQKEYDPKNQTYIFFILTFSPCSTNFPDHNNFKVFINPNDTWEGFQALLA